MITKPAVASLAPIIVTATGVISEAPREIVGIHYLNTTAGAGRVEIKGSEGNKGVVLGSDAANGNDSFCPSQPMKFDKVTVTFITGTGVVTLLVN